MFAIRFLQEPVPQEWLVHYEQAVLAEIVINEFRERLALVVEHWTKADYERQWVDGIEKLISGGPDAKSLLVTQFYRTPNTWYAAECWPLYRHGETAYMHNLYVPSKGLKHQITLEELYEKIGVREKGVSEWTVSIDELKEWLAELKSHPTPEE